MTIFSILLFMLWISALSLTVFGTWIAIKHFNNHPPHMDAAFNLIPISILKPLKDLEEGIEENLKSFFNLDYPRYELLFSVSHINDPVIPIVKKLLTQFPQVQAKLIIGEIKAGQNPKINNLILSYNAAQYEWILISDSNARAKPHYLKKLAANLDNGVGVITAVVAAGYPKGLGGQLEAVAMNTFCVRGVFLANYFGHPCVLGKSMFFKKTTAQRFGGIQTLAPFLAEDYMMGKAIHYLGLRVVIMNDPVIQYIGQYSLETFWLRHVRWGRIRKSQVPMAFLGEILTCSMVSGCLGAISFMEWGLLSPLIFLFLHLLIWFICDFCLMRKLTHSMDSKVRSDILLIWLFKECLFIPLWIHIALGNKVFWRGQNLKLQPGGLVEVY